MTEFETATITFQNASLWAAHIRAGVAGLVGLVQCALIFYGLKLMQRSNTDRQRQMDLAEKRHEESLSALQSQTDLAEKRHEESLSALQSQTDLAEKRHEESLLTLRTLIERTAPR